MLELFANPAALTVGGAMVSSPILIHLINRMRFKRLRWAAMEFLLKSQKRNRRRLILEQLLLLVLRCLLIALVALLFSRFRGCEIQGDTNKLTTPTLHVVLLNDSLSMLDKVKGKEDCFSLAKKQVAETIAPAIGKSTTNDRLMVVQLSRVAFEGNDYKPQVYDGLEDKARLAELERDLGKMTCSKLSLSLAPGLARVKEIVDAETENGKVVVHIVGDFRKHRWFGSESSQVHGIMQDLSRLKQVESVYLVDVADPKRDPDRKTQPAPHDNLAIVEVRPNTRVATVGSEISCTINVANYGIQSQDVMVELFAYESGERIDEANYTPAAGALNVPAGKTAVASVKFAVRDVLKTSDIGFYRLGVRLLNANRGALDNDSLDEDNVRYVVIEVRRKIPILILDGGGEASRLEGDSYWIKTALKVARAQYEVVFGDQLAGGNVLAALESPELSKFTSIMLVNVVTLCDKGVDPESENGKAQTKVRRDILERFVANGGGVAFFMGMDINPDYYNKYLWNQGTSVFPVPLGKKSQLNGPSTGGPEPVTGKGKTPPGPARDQVLLRDDVFGADSLPIFGPVFKDPKDRHGLLQLLTVKRFWPTLSETEWKGDNNKVLQVVNLPNTSEAKEYSGQAIALGKRLTATANAYELYGKGLNYFRDKLLEKVDAKVLDPKTKTFKTYKSYDLAAVLEEMLAYNGSDGKFANLVDFWDLPDEDVKDLKARVEALRRTLLYSHPFLVVRDYGQGRVAAFMVGAGPDWWGWLVGYHGVISELQNYLTSTAGDSGKIVGDPLVLKVDGNRFPREAILAQCLLFPTQSDLSKQKPNLVGVPRDLKYTEQRRTDETGRPIAPLLEYTTPQTRETGYYQVLLKKIKDSSNEEPLAQWTQVFNIDALREANLERASTSEINDAVKPKDAPSKVTWWRREAPAAITNKPWDLSEWPYLFLIFLALLVAEQALAVHLSFHLRTSEAELPTQAVRPQARAA